MKPKLENKPKTKSFRGRIPGVMGFPEKSIEETLEVIKIINDKLATGMMQNTLCPFLKTSKGSDKFKLLLRSAHKYGMINKSYSQKEQKIEITDLGKIYLKPTSNENKKNALLKFFNNSRLFQTYYDKVKASKLPPNEFGPNQISEISKMTDRMAVNAFNVFKKNLIYLNLLSGDEIVLEIPQSTHLSQNDDDKSVLDTSTPSESTLDTSTPSESTPEVSLLEKPPQIFIASGKNQTPVKIILDFLTKYKVKHVHAIDEPHSGRPISKKVSDLMDSSNSAIFIFTKEDSNKIEGKDEYLPNTNLTFELGAASKMYEKIIIFKEKNINFGSDFSDLGYITFDPNNMEAKISELLQELIVLGFMTISVN